MIKKWLGIYRMKKKFILKEDGTQIAKSIVGIKYLELEGNNGIPENCFFLGKIKVGYATTLGVHNFFIGEIEIGKY